MEIQDYEDGLKRLRDSSALEAKQIVRFHTWLGTAIFLLAILVWIIPAGKLPFPFDLEPRVIAALMFLWSSHHYGRAAGQRSARRKFHRQLEVDLYLSADSSADEKSEQVENKVSPV